MWSTEIIVFPTKYPEKLVNYTISRFIAAKASDQPVSSPAVSDRSVPFPIGLPFKNQIMYVPNLNS